jgi:hypothetical protein
MPRKQEVGKPTINGISVLVDIIPTEMVTTSYTKINAKNDKVK